ncbi:uncharacterized protein LOC118491586 [Helianthus annuus]|uniref:uncharacterized protein LOC118491586 n=1 Tax=Helianthus annuus TaxID=4232 RepID=UPI0016531EFC|nr:uncharacterized protein LOC118491586 [Helianthus annuus]
MATPPSSRTIQMVQNDHDKVTMEDITHEEDNENQVETLENEEAITPDVVAMHREKLKKYLEDLERQEKLDSLRAILSFDTPSNQEGVDPQNKSSGSDPLETFMTALRQMSSEEREDLITGKKQKGKGKEKEKENQSNDGLDQPYLPWDLAEISKFTKRIAEAPMPPKTKLPPNFDSYDGTRDPEDHLQAFKGAGQLGRWPMPVWCHMFVQTLTEGARLWFDSLPPGEIDSYEELSEKFLRNFGRQRKVVKNPNEILHIRQRDNERIDQFMERFVKESMNIKDVPEVMKISSFINGLKHAQLCEKLGKEFPYSFDNLMDKVRAFVRGKETVSKAKEMDTPPRRVNPAAKPPEKGPKAQPNEYCDFHKGFGHKTDDCVYLKREIEAAVKTGKLAHLVKEIKEGGGDRKGKDAREPGRADVDMIRRRDEFDTTRSVKAKILGSPDRMKAPVLMPHLEENEVQRLPLNISAIIAGHKVARIHVDGGSGVEVIYEHYFLRFDRDVRDRLEEDSIPLVGFNNSVSHPLGKIRLPFTVGVGDRVRTINLTFTVVRAPSKYNAIPGRPGIGDLQAQASTPHGALVFQTPKGLAWVKSAYEVISSVPEGEISEKPQKDGVEVWVLCDRFPEQTVKVGSHLSDKCKSALKELLLLNIDVFAFQHGHMTGIPRSLTEHRLNTYTWAKPVKQKRRSMGPSKRRAAREETKKLLRAGIVREVKYPSWVANPIMVQ